MLHLMHHHGWWRVPRGVLIAVGVGAASVWGETGGLGLREMFSDKIGYVRQAIDRGDWESYATGYAWHLPYGYKESVRARLNEKTWGGGFGRTIEDEDGDRHSVYVMAFSDSHRALQVNVGYGWQRYWELQRGLSVGAGYLAFLFSRKDVANHLPIPAALPCASVRYGGIEMIGLFVPRVSRDIKGDVLFVYLRMPLGSGHRQVQRVGATRSVPARFGR